MAQPSVRIAIHTSAGMGHLTPLLRLAATLVEKELCHVTLITIQPTVSISESKLIAGFLSQYPQVSSKEIHLLSFDPSTANCNDPFFLRWEATRRTVANLLPSLLSSLSPPISALISDISLISSVVPVTTQLSLPTYIFFPAPARIFAVLASFHTIVGPKIKSGLKETDIIQITGLSPISASSVPPLLLNPETLFHNIFSSDSPNCLKVTGFLLNTYESLEPETLKALNNGAVHPQLPPVHAVAPLLPREFVKTESGGGAYLNWLDEQPLESVVYISFGSRTSMSREQIRELAIGIMKSGYRCLWVVKTKKVDRDEDEKLGEVIGDELLGKIEDQGLIVNYWVDQAKILGHKAVGGFVTHVGWNSVLEATMHGVRLLAWPLHGDQKVAAEAVLEAGIALWDSSWGWEHDAPIKGEDIGNKIKEMMESSPLRERAREFKELSRKAAEESDANLKKLTEEWNKIKNSA